MASGVFFSVGVMMKLAGAKFTSAACSTLEVSRPAIGWLAMNSTPAGHMACTGSTRPVQALCPAGVEFIASHPMAGRETSSVEHAAEVNFAPANFIITPTKKNTPAGIQWARELAEVLGFKHICTLTVQEHDRMIGYVSQLCHAIAVSLMCANDNSSLCEYTGDSFRDLTRIARINDKMWAELFLWNKQNLISEIDQFDSALQEMRAALVADDRDKLEQMFRLSTQRRAAFDKKLPE